MLQPMSPSLISLDAWLQAEKKRIDKLNKGLAERTIDAQRVSGAQTGSPGAMHTMLLHTSQSLSPA